MEKEIQFNGDDLQIWITLSLNPHWVQKFKKIVEVENKYMRIQSEKTREEIDFLNELFANNPPEYGKDIYCYFAAIIIYARSMYILKRPELSHFGSSKFDFSLAGQNLERTYDDEEAMSLYVSRRPKKEMESEKEIIDKMRRAVIHI